MEGSVRSEWSNLETEPLTKEAFDAFAQYIQDSYRLELEARDREEQFRSLNKKSNRW